MKMQSWLRLTFLVIALSLFGWFVQQPSVLAQVITWPASPYTPVNVNFSTATATLVAAPSAGAVCVYGLQLVNAGASATTITVYLDGGTTAVWSAYLQAGGGSANWPLQNGNAKNPYFISNLTTAFVVKSSTAVQINGGIYAATCP